MTAETFAGPPQKANFTAWYKKRPMNLKDELEEYYRLPLEDFDTCNPSNLNGGQAVTHSFKISRVWLGIFLLFQIQLSRSSEFFRAAAILLPISLQGASLQPNAIRTLMFVKQRLRLARTAVTNDLGG
ncbi:hypothetical protein K503DRAFT_805214 [Rhizopogon vinicolor AM-OR11-026]|uniref:HAT C-terminal dimerisation domain-containing protein n=1 Tax=Rhizopogon vinicolor AM-OR11-026 TaxID=1314800 RepID=A0A1B7MIQ6_9AGAM|nr:hypothetical protein K503DRAFT_805214 [Rhizopogon vinicolor AM-OR11-026]